MGMEGGPIRVGGGSRCGAFGVVRCRRRPVLYIGSK